MHNRFTTAKYIAACAAVWLSVAYSSAMAAPVPPAAPLVPEALPAAASPPVPSVSSALPSELPALPAPPTAAMQVQPEEISEEDAAALLQEIAVESAVSAPATQVTSVIYPASDQEPPAERDEPGVLPQNYDLLPLEDSTLQDENLMILGITANHKEKAGKAVEAYRHAHGYFLPLGALSDILDFLIAVDPASGKANGWFLKEENRFSLDMNAQRVSSQGQSRPYIPSLVVKTDRDIFVDSYLLSQWLPLGFKLREQFLTLEVDSSERFAPEERVFRRRAWQAAEARKLAPKSDLPQIELPYQPYALPIIDMTINENMQRNRTPAHMGSYSARVETELDHLTTDMFLGGSTTTKAVDHLRARAHREDETATLFGDLHARTFEVGDVNPQTLALLGQNNPGRGFRISNRDFTRPTGFDFTDFVGDAQPGWDVELYWNGRLLEFTVVDESGRYEFLHVPIYYGNNNFKIVRYGPQGQVEEEVRRFLVDESFLETGEFNYTFSVDQKDTPLVPFANNRRTIPGFGDSLRSIGDFEYGMTRNLTSHFGYSTTPLESDDSRHNFLTTGLRGNAGGVLGNADVAYDVNDSEWASRLVFLSRVWDVDIKAEQKTYSRDFVSDLENVGKTTLSRSSINSLNFVKSFNIKGFPSFSMGGGMDYETYYDGPKISTFRHNLSTQLFGLQFSNSTRWSDNDVSNTQRRYIDGTFSVRAIYNKILFRVATDYAIHPREQLEALILSAQKSFSRKMFGRISLRKGLTDNSNRNNDKFKLAGQLTWDLEKYKLSGVMEMDEERELFVGTTLSFSTAFQPKVQDWFMSGQYLGNQGAVTTRAFLDNDGDGFFSAGDKPLEGVDFLSSGIARKTNHSGAAMAPGHGASRPVIVELDSESLPDINYYPSGVKKYEVYTRPGAVVHIDFPVVKTAEIDGTIYFEGNHSKRGLEKAVVELLDTKGRRVQAVYSEFDGYYLFEHVPPGRYFIAVSEEQLARENLVANFHDLNVNADQPVYSGYDITIERYAGDPLEFQMQ